ncbi:MAG: LPS export ABC transporter periplasmic protein LptC [Leptolyngbyaceae cyanobacterium bins.302]|nr:LPS export ABC transporter periplasmic protein LptC [Leptolyngbyaceae cyanobacterium bins.302]
MVLPDIKMPRLGYTSLCCALLLSSSLLLNGCNTNRAEQKLAQDAKQLEGENFDTDLTFNSVTLEDFDQKGRLWWKVKAEQAAYSRDKKVARVKKPNGEFYQDGKAILKVSGDGGEVLKDGERIFLRGNIIAKDIRDGLTLKGNELEWQPKNDVIFIRNTVNGARGNVKASAKSGKYLTRQRRLELDGNVKAESKDPGARFNGERLVWLVDKQKMMSDRPLQMERIENGTVTDRAKAAQSEMDLKGQVVTLKEAAQLDIASPPVQVAGNLIKWQLKPRLISSSQPITINNAKDNLTLSGNQGELQLKTKILTLVGNVRGSGGPRQSQLASDRLTWNIDTQQFQAEGNVNYQQAKPPLNLSGPRADGTLKDQQVVVSGGRVVTQFVP